MSEKSNSTPAKTDFADDFGRVRFTIEEYRKSRGISKNKIVLNANVQRTQLQNYCNNKVARIDLFALARICN